MHSDSANSIKEIACRTASFNILCKHLSISCAGPLEIEFLKGFVNGDEVTCRSIDLETNRVLSDEESETLRIIPNDKYTTSSNDCSVEVDPLNEEMFEFISDYGLPFFDYGQYSISINDYNNIGDRANGLVSMVSGWQYVTGTKPIVLTFKNADVYFGRTEVTEPVIIFPSVATVYNENFDLLFGIASHSSISPESIQPFKIDIPVQMISGTISLNNITYTLIRTSGVMKYDYFSKTKEVDMNMNELYLNSPRELSIYCEFDMKDANKYSFSLDGNASMIKIGKNKIQLSFWG